MARKVAVTKIWDTQTVTTAAAVTSSAVEIQEAEAMSLHLTAISGTTPSISFTYSLSPSLHSGVWTTPQSGVTIGTAKAAVDVMDFAPEAAGAIKIIATNIGTGPVVLTSYLVVQEAA
jgi:hypothetical protein